MNECEDDVDADSLSRRMYVYNMTRLAMFELDYRKILIYID